MAGQALVKTREHGTGLQMTAQGESPSRQLLLVIEQAQMPNASVIRQFQSRSGLQWQAVPCVLRTADAPNQPICGQNQQAVGEIQLVVEVNF